MKYILFNAQFSIVSNCNEKNSSTSITTTPRNLPYLMSHFKLSSMLYSCQLLDIFAYETASLLVKSNSIIVYNFHCTFSQSRLYVFVRNSQATNLPSKFNNSYSIGDYYTSAKWLERECSELSSLSFYGQKDLRNLMLQYGETSAPLKKSFPSIGLKETIYCAVSDSIVQKDISVSL